MTKVLLDIEAMPFPLRSYQQNLVTAMTTSGFKPGEMQIISAGRQTGKSLYYQYANQWANMMNLPIQIQWQKLPGRKLKAYTEGSSPRGLRENDMDEVQKWLWTNIPSAKRLSFDMWLFKEDKHITMFFMKWSS
jgi:hypothetical protein